MAYNLKYYSEFYNYYDEVIRVEILGRDFAGSATEINMMATPAVLSYPGDDMDVFNPILGSQVTLNLLSTTNFQFIDLHNSDARAHRVDLKKDGTLFWKGWILPDLFTEPYVAPPYPVSVTARCGLGELKEIDFPATIQSYLNSDVTDGTESTFVNLYSIITQALRQIQTDLNLNDAVNVYATASDAEADTPLSQTYVNVSTYADMNFYEAISDILRTFGARLYQMDAEWWVVRIKELGDTMVVRKTDLIGTAVSTDNTKTTSFQVGRPTGAQIVNESPQLDILPAWKKFTWVQDLGLKESIFENSKFTEWENIEGIDRRTGETEVIDTNIIGWTDAIAGQLQRKTDSNGEYYGQFAESVTSNPNVDYYIEQIITGIEVSNYQKLKIKLVFDLLSSDTGITEDSFSFYVRNGTKYLYLTSNNVFDWTTTPTLIWIEDAQTSFVSGRYGRNNAGSVNWKTYEFTVSDFEDAGDLHIRVYYATNTLLRIKELSGIIVDINEIRYENDLETTVIINENNIYTPDDIQVVGGDLPDINNAAIIWENGYRISDGSPTVVWHERDGTDVRLLELIGYDYSGIYQIPQFKLSIPILSQNIKLDSCIIDYLVNAKKYVCASAEIDLQTCIFRGTYMEFSVWEDVAAWILATGEWNDDGVWVDTETWNDDATDLIEYTFTAKGAQELPDFEPGDTIDTLPTFGSYYYDYMVDDVTLVLAAPYTVTGTLYYVVSVAASTGGYSVTFNATIGGVAKTIKINVNL